MFGLNQDLMTHKFQTKRKIKFICWIKTKNPAEASFYKLRRQSRRQMRRENQRPCRLIIAQRIFANFLELVKIKNPAEAGFY